MTDYLKDYDEFLNKKSSLLNQKLGENTSIQDLLDIIANSGAYDFTGSISGKSTQDVVDAFGTGDDRSNVITDLINARLDTSTKEILGEFTFGTSGAIKMITDTNNGLWISPTGILGKKAGVTTFAVDTSGNATFGGTLSSGVSITSPVITGGTITGSTLQTATSGTRLKLHYVAGDFAGYLDFLTNDTVLAQLKTDVLFPSGGGAKLNLNYANTQSGETNEMAVAWSGSDLYNGNAWFRLRNYYCGLYYDAGTARTTFYQNARYKSAIIPDITNSIDLGSSSYTWRNLYIGTNIITPSINLNGTTRTSWPTSFSGDLSDLTIDTAKAWGSYGISGLGTITPSSNISYNLGSTSYYWDIAYLRRVEFYSYTAGNPSSYTYGDMWHTHITAGDQEFRGYPSNDWGSVASFDMTAV